MVMATAENMNPTGSGATGHLTHADRAERRRLIAAAVKGGMSPGDAANAFDVSASTVESACKQHGVNCPSPGRAPSTKVLRVVSALLTTANGEEVARRCKVSKQYVSIIRKAAKDAGIPVLDPTE